MKGLIFPPEFEIMRINRIYFTITILLLAVLPLFAEKPPEGEGWSFYSKEKSSVDGAGITLLPDFDQKEDVLIDLLANDPAMSIELLYSMPLPETGGKEIIPFLFDRLQSISTMEGLEYYSANRDAMTVYLEKCYLVERPGRKGAVDDPEFSHVPDLWEAIVYQRDNTFGNNWYSLEMTNTEESIRMKLTNAQDMRYFIFSILNPGGVVIELILIPREDSLQFYAVSQLEIKSREVFGKKIHLPGVFDHRVSAYQSWIAKRIYDNPVPGQIER